MEMDRPFTSSEIESAEATLENTDSSQEGAADEECVNGMELPVYEAAITGNTVGLSVYGRRLSELLTATLNTVLHIYIACALPDNAAKVTTVDSILRICPALLSQSNKRGETALHIAARHGHKDIVQKLMEVARSRGPEEGCWSMLIRATNNDKDTALHEAVRFNNLDVVKILTGQDPGFSYSANDAGETPLYMAVERGHLHLVTEILKTCKNVAFQGPNGRTALHAAVSYNDIEITRKLLSYYTHERALTKAVDEVGMTPLHLAALLGHTSIVKQLLESDKSAAYVRDRDDKRTALHIAASKGHLCIFKELISQCPDCCELVDKRHRSILHYAIEKNQLHIQDFIRDNRWLSNILLNGKDVDLNTPLQQLLAVSSHEVRKPSGECMSIMKSSSEFIRDARVDKMAFNNRNQNAFDIIRTDDAVSAWEKDLRRHLKVNGGRPSRRIVMDQDNGEQETEIKGAIKDNSRDAIMQELKQVHLIVATLIATVTFAAGLTVPGGYESQKGPDQGLAVLRYNPAFIMFKVMNTISMVFSASSVALHFLWVEKWGPEMLNRFTYLTTNALVFMLLAFIAGLWTVFRDITALSMSLFTSACLIVGTLFCTKQNVQRFLHQYIPGCPGFLIDLLLAAFGG